MFSSFTLESERCDNRYETRCTTLNSETTLLLRSKIRYKSIVPTRYTFADATVPYLLQCKQRIIFPFTLDNLRRIIDADMTFLRV